MARRGTQPLSAGQGTRRSRTSAWPNPRASWPCSATSGAGPENCSCGETTSTSRPGPVRFATRRTGTMRIVHAVRAHGLLGAQPVQAQAQAPDSPYLFTSRSAEDGSPRLSLHRRHPAVAQGEYRGQRSRSRRTPGIRLGRVQPDCPSRTSANRPDIARSRPSPRPTTSPMRCILMRKRVERPGGGGPRSARGPRSGLGRVVADQWRKFQLERQVTELRVVGGCRQAPSKIVSPLRKPGLRVLPGGPKQPATVR